MIPNQPFNDLGQVQGYALKSQYVRSLEVLDETELKMRTQLDQIAALRSNLEELMAQLDARLTVLSEAPSTSPEDTSPVAEDASSGDVEPEDMMQAPFLTDK
jgi:hypothetical protein